jgi:hypothetical protein
MSIEHFKVAAVACVLAFGLAACGGEDSCGNGVCDGSESAGSCASDCGCGNGVANPGEDCDGVDLGGGTCMEAVQRGGTLSCNANCTFDVSACTLASCGNNIVEDGEGCDGADLGGRTCSGIGYGGGTLSCETDCMLDVSTCCTDTCPTAGLGQCVGNSLRVCAPSAAGCLAWQVTDCAANDDVCETTSATEASCTCIDRCELAEMRCEGATIETCMESGGCTGWVQTDDCSTGGAVCAVAPSGPLCAPDASAENCAEPYPLALGDNVVAWAAVDADYLTSAPSCESTAMTGPDLVLSYTAPEAGFATFSMNKPASARQLFVVSTAACGTVTPELACNSDFSPTTLSSEFPVTMGTTYHVYLRDTTSGAAPLDNPMFVNLAFAGCSTITNTVTLSPANATSVVDRTPILSAQFTYPIDPSAGVITVTGNMGTNLSYDLAMGPAAIAILDGAKTLQIDPGIVFSDDEILTISWTGLKTASCNTLIPAPTWTVQVTDPPCFPGQAGMVGTAQTRIPTGLATFTEYFVAADEDPNGYVYVGGTGNLYRTPKAGGTTQDLEAIAGLTASHLGYDMVVLGSELYTLEAVTSATSGILWRLTTDGGATWPKQDYAQLPFVANDDMWSMAQYNGRIYFTTDEGTDGTQIWSVSAGASMFPQPATLETTALDEDFCGIAVDDDYYYLSCSGGDRLVRVHRTTFAKELITDAIDFNSTRNAIHIHDIDGDGRADVLYVQGYGEEVNYVCAPNTGPFYTDVLTGFGTGTSNYGLGFDKANGVLWMFDDDTREFVKIQ